MTNAGTTSWGAPSPQGHDWWQASDGLWYPPAGGAAVPSVAPVAAPAPPAYLQGTVVTPTASVRVSYDAAPESVPRLRPFYVGFLAIPQFFGVLGVAILALFSMYAAMFGVLFLGRVNPRSHATIVRLYRYQWRLTTFLLCWRQQPPTAPAPGADDAGDDPARLSVAYGGEGLARLGPFLKPFKAIPAMIGLFFAAIGAYFAVLIGTLAVIFTGTFPQSQRDKVVAVYQRATRLNAYLLLTDEKP